VLIPSNIQQCPLAAQSFVIAGRAKPRRITGCGDRNSGWYSLTKPRLVMVPQVRPSASSARRPTRSVTSRHSPPEVPESRIIVDNPGASSHPGGREFESR
jgi:hypothetical protein